MTETNYYVYVLLCNNGNYYTGFTTDVTRRYQEHLDGTLKCKYTRSFKPIKLAQCWSTFDNKSEALKMERFIKKLSKHEKQDLITYPDKLMPIFQCIIRDPNEKPDSCHQ